MELWITCRMTHVFSLGHMLGRAGCDSLADHGVAALRERFRDPVNGGWYASVAADGPTTRSKTAYPHAFVVLAATSAMCAGRPGARELLDESLEVLLGRFWDDEYGMVVEEFDETFTTLDPYRGVNANMHTVEALLSAADATGDSGLRDRALRIVTRVVRDLAPAHDWRIPEHFDESWNPLPDYNIDSPADPFRPYGATIGHWLEWARLSLHLRAALGRAPSGSPPAWLSPTRSRARSTRPSRRAARWSTARPPASSTPSTGPANPSSASGCTGSPPRPRRRPPLCMPRPAMRRTPVGTRPGGTTSPTFFIDTELGSWHHELDPDQPPEQHRLVRQARRLPRLPGHPHPPTPPHPTLATALRDGPLR